MTRHALYFAPPAGNFSDTAARWLGRDAVQGRSANPIHPDLWPLTTSARRYGFHATLKAPFRLAQGQTQSALITAMAKFARLQTPVVLDGLRLVNLDGFLALTPMGDTAALNRFAARIVQDFEDFRAPLTQADIARRNPDRLTPQQRALLHRWGYPYVMEEFRFHMTLTDHLTPEQANWAMALAQDTFSQYLHRPITIDALTLFVEAPDGQFHHHHSAPLIG